MPVCPYVLFVLGTYAIFSALLYSNPLNTQSGTTMLLPNSPAKYKVVLIILDAFRRDYYGHWATIKQYISNHSDRSKFIGIKANAPTMTAERIQAMMIGSEMTQPSVFANFISTKTPIDNVIRKIESSLLLGDDTWDHIFTFSESITCRSFEVFDLDTCDNTVISNIFSNLGKYDLIVGHMLGLDHIGHTYSSIDVLKMSHKLQQI